MEDSALKPCPFCGGEVFVKYEEDYSGFPYRPECMDEECSGSHIWYESEIDAIEAWNKRTYEASTLEELVELSQKLGLYDEDNE